MTRDLKENPHGSDPLSKENLTMQNGNSAQNLKGFTLADQTGYKRLRKLADTKFNLLMDIRQKEDKVKIIEAEIRSLYHQLSMETGIGYHYQTGIIDPVIPVGEVSSDDL